MDAFLYFIGDNAGYILGAAILYGAWRLIYLHRFGRKLSRLRAEVEEITQGRR